MAEKIPYEVLLPIALELFKQVPFPAPENKDDNLLCVAQREKLASNFAMFYHYLHQKLVNPTPADSFDNPLR